MKIRTLEQLSDQLASDLSWRKKELAILRSMIRSSKSKPGKLEAMIRSGITVLYAHWEGYIKAGATIYLEYISRRGLKYKNLKISFRALAARSHLSAAMDSTRMNKMIELIDFLLNQQDERSRVPHKNAIHTKSNLSSRVFKDIINLLSLDYSPYATKEKLIDRTLLHFRNNIAHGKGLYPSFEQTENLFDEIIFLMNQFKNQIENAAAIEAYRIIGAV